LIGRQGDLLWRCGLWRLCKKHVNFLCVLHGLYLIRPNKPRVRRTICESSNVNRSPQPSSMVVPPSTTTDPSIVACRPASTGKEGKDVQRGSDTQWCLHKKCTKSAASAHDFYHHALQTNTMLDAFVQLLVKARKPGEQVRARSECTNAAEG
jgi:hypothetical protein